MKAWIAVLPWLLFFTIAQPAPAQKTKFLNKSDTQYSLGNYSKSLKFLKKYKKSLVKLPANNPYLPTYYIRLAKLDLAQGILTEFDSTLQMAIQASLDANGANTESHARTLFEVAEIYYDYGHYRLCRDYVEQTKSTYQNASGALTKPINARISLLEAGAMIEQGYFHDAIANLDSLEKYLAKRATDKETYVENDEIKTRRVPVDEIQQRFSQYAQLLTLKLYAYGQMGRISMIGGDQQTADAGYSALSSWMKGKKRFLGETDLTDIRYRYLYVKIYKENQGKLPDSDLQLHRILNDLKKKTKPSNDLAHDVYLAYLEELLHDGNRARYHNLKMDYQKAIDKYFPKKSIHRLNLKAVEFNSKLSRDKTKDLERDALAALKELPENYKTSERILHFLYDISLAEKRYTNAENYLKRKVEIQKELYGENTPAYHLAKIHLANFYLDYTNKIDEAGKVYEESYNTIVAREIGEQHKDLLDILNHLATWYELTDHYSKASQTLKKASEAAVSKYRNDDILFGIELTQLAKLGIKLGEYDKAETNIKNAIEIIDLKTNRDYDEYVPAYINALETQAKLYGILGFFDEAQDNLDDTRKIIKRSREDLSLESTAQELTSLFIQLGRYSNADHLLEGVFEEYESLYGPHSIRLIDPLVEKAYILLAKGEYTEAERTAIRAHKIAMGAFGDKSTKTAPTQKLLSTIYYTLGDYEKAEDNITLALNSQEKQFSRQHVEVAKSLAQLALIKFYKGDDRRTVERLMLEARDIMEAKLGKQNPQYAEILKNVAIFYISEQRFDIAFNSLTAAESIWRAKAGRKNNINTASIYTLTGDVYYQQKKYDKAEEFYEKAKLLYVKFFSTNHPEYVKVLSKLSKVHYMQKNYKSAKKLIEEALENYAHFINDYFPALSEREKAKYWNTIKGDFEFYNTLAFSNLEDFKDLTANVYDYQLLTKALLLSTSIKIRERIMNSTDEQLKEQYNTWVQKKELLTLALSMSPDQLQDNEIDPTLLQQEVENLEKDLSQKSELFGQSFENQRITYKMVANSLAPNEIAMEMVRYRYFDHAFTDSVIYAALYIKKDMARPQAIIMDKGKHMETRYFKYYRNAITGKIPDRVSYDVFWAPIYRELGLASTIYLSADGVYNQINLEAIPTPDGKYVIDNSNIVLVSNTRDLYLNKRKSRPATTRKTAYMFGNPTFYLTASAKNTIAPLPGTEKEISQLDYLLSQKGWAIEEYIEKSASEEKIKEMNSPKIFHIATHGLYRPTETIDLEKEIEGNEAVMTQNPLMRTGLLLRGAGDLLDKTDYNYNIDNGILTAYEAMSLNLDKTDLVVLSACETGLGDVEQGEGVYGLQRAFLVAGAKTLIMSMFKVDDDATQKLMVKFYQKFINSGNLRQSFIEAKKELRTEYPEPIYWGAFMMIGLE